MTASNENTRKLENQAPHLNYYPHWLDNLARDVILQGAVFNGQLRGAEQVGKMLSFARSAHGLPAHRRWSSSPARTRRNGRCRNRIG
jgi:hypothetical protein